MAIGDTMPSGAHERRASLRQLRIELEALRDRVDLQGAQISILRTRVDALTPMTTQPDDSLKVD